jgi:hypothetical protein
MLIYLCSRFHLICVWIFGFNSGYVYFSFRIMCTWLFIIIMVHDIHHWNYLRFNVYFLVTSMLIYPWMRFHLGLKPHWASMASPFNINGTISFFNKFFSYLFIFCFYLGYFAPPWIWMVIEVSNWKNISHSDKEVPWSMCDYCCMWVLHILIKSLTYIELIIFKKIGKFFFCINLDGHKIAAWFFLPFVNYHLFMCYGKVHL